MRKVNGKRRLKMRDSTTALRNRLRQPRTQRALPDQALKRKPGMIPETSKAVKHSPRAPQRVVNLRVPPRVPESREWMCVLKRKPGSVLDTSRAVNHSLRAPQRVVNLRVPPQAQVAGGEARVIGH